MGALKRLGDSPRSSICLVALAWRSSCSSIELPYLRVCARADWPAWNEISGVRYWNHAIAPCPKCLISHAEMVSAGQVSVMSLDGGKWPAFTSKEYLDLIKKSKVVACICLKMF